MKAGGDPKARKAELDRAEEKKKREEAKRLLEEESKLFKPVAAVQKVEPGKIVFLHSTMTLLMSIANV